MKATPRSCRPSTAAVDRRVTRDELRRLIQTIERRPAPRPLRRVERLPIELELRGDWRRADSGALTREEVLPLDHVHGTQLLAELSNSTGDVLALLGGQLAAVVGLASVYDRLGRLLASSLDGAATEEDLDRTLAAEAGDDDLGALVRTIADLSALGPRGRALARDVLGSVLAFAGRR